MSIGLVRLRLSSASSLRCPARGPLLTVLTLLYCAVRNGRHGRAREAKTKLLRGVHDLEQSQTDFVNDSMHWPRQADSGSRRLRSGPRGDRHRQPPERSAPPTEH